MDLAEAGATIQLCSVYCWCDSTSARGCRGSGYETKEKEPNKLFSSQLLEKIHKGDINLSKSKALECETAGRKKFKRKRIKQKIKKIQL